MTNAPQSSAVSDDDLYDTLYDVRKEAEEIGNYVEDDPYPAMNAARGRGAVQ